MRKQRTKVTSTDVGLKRPGTVVPAVPLSERMLEAAVVLALDPANTATAKNQAIRTVLEHLGIEKNTSVMPPSEMTIEDIDAEIARVRPLTMSRE